MEGDLTKPPPEFPPVLFWLFRGDSGAGGGGGAEARKISVLKGFRDWLPEEGLKELSDSCEIGGL